MNTVKNKQAINALLLIIIIVIAALLIVCYDDVLAQPAPIVLPEWRQDTDTVMNRDGNVLMFFNASNDTLVFDPATGFYFKSDPANLLDSALLDSIANAEGRFGVTAGLWTNIDDTLANLMLSTDSLWQWRRTTDSSLIGRPLRNASNDSVKVTIYADSIFSNDPNDTTNIYRLQISGNYCFPQSDGAADAVLKTNGSGVLSWETRASRGADEAGWGITYSDGQYSVTPDIFSQVDGYDGNLDSLNPVWSTWDFACNYQALDRVCGIEFIARDSTIYELKADDINKYLYLSGIDFYSYKALMAGEWVVLNADSSGSDAGIRATDAAGDLWDWFYNEAQERWQSDTDVYVTGHIEASGSVTADSLATDHIDIGVDVTGPADCIPDSLVNYSAVPNSALPGLIDVDSVRAALLLKIPLKDAGLQEDGALYYDTSDACLVLASDSAEPRNYSFYPDWGQYLRDGTDRVDTAIIYARVAGGKEYIAIKADTAVVIEDNLHAVGEISADSMSAAHIVATTQLATAAGAIADSSLSARQKHHWIGRVVSYPNAWFDDDSVCGIWIETDYALTIDTVKVACDADPTTELDWRLMFADDRTTRANADTICTITSTSGTAEVTSFDDATIAAGKAIYVLIYSDPDADITEVIVDVGYTYD